MKRSVLLGVFVGLLGVNFGINLRPLPAIAQSAPQSSEATPKRIDGNTQPHLPVTVKLLEPGTGDRRLLRFKPTVGSRQLSRMNMGLKTQLSISAQAMPPQAMPPMSLPMLQTTLETEVTEVEPNGDIHYQVHYRSADIDLSTEKNKLPGAVVTTLEADLKKLENMQVAIVMTDQGQIKTGQFKMPDQISPLMQQNLEPFSQSLNQLSSPFPSEAVGVGATWQTTTALNIGGVAFTQTITYKLVSLDGNLATLAVEIEQQAPPQLVQLPGKPTDPKLELVQLHGTGTGQITLDLSKPFAVRSHLAIASQSQMKLPISPTEPALEVRTQSDINLTLQPQ